MAKNVEVTATETPAVKTRKARSPSAPKAVYAVIRILDAEGNVVSVPKGQVEVISFERSAEAVLTKVESGDHPGAIYLRGILPVGRAA